jgi:trehalose-phosphatase
MNILRIVLVSHSKTGLSLLVNNSLCVSYSDFYGLVLCYVMQAFAGFDLWLAAENGMFLRHTKGDWMTTMPEHVNMDWVESVQLVFDYFCERTPRSYVESRETSLVWNYKYADVEFGRVQARDMLQHLWTGPISNAAVDVVQGSKSVEVRPVGVSKGSAIDRILYEIIQSKHAGFHIDFVMCIGHFLSKVCLPSQSQYSFVSGSLYSCLLHKISHHCHPSNSLNSKIEDLMDCMNWILTG